MKLANVQVVGFDGSILSELALHSALRAAADADLPTVHVLMVGQETEGGVLLPSDIVLSRFQALMNLRLTVGAMAARWGQRHGFIRIVCHVMVGDPAERILDLAESSNADRIILGVRGLREHAHHRVGSTARRVARSASRAVELQGPLSPQEHRGRTDALRLFLLLGDGFSAERHRSGPRVATC